MDAIDDRQNVTITVTNVNEAPVVTGDTTPSFEENANRAIATYTGTDPERDTLTWTVSGTDADDFWISQRGQLHFLTPPSFEIQTTYTVTITATDDETTPPLSGSLSVTVTVTDAEEEGTITIDLPRGWDGTPFRAELDDDDGGIIGETWQWQRSSNRSNWEDISGAISYSYLATADDVGQYLRATVSYEDNRGSGKEASASVTGRIEDSTDRPAMNNVPTFSQATTTRSIGQGTAAGRKIGAPLRATDEDTGDVLTYSLDGTDAVLFDIDPATGQVLTRAVLDYDPEGTNSYSVQVRVHDGYGPDYQSTDVGVDATITVTISVTAVVQRPPSVGVGVGGGSGGGSDSGSGSGSGSGGGGGGGGTPPPDPSEIVFSPDAISFEAVQGGDNPPPQTLKVWNVQEREMAFGTSENAPWLTRSPSAGISDGPDDAVTIRLSVDVSSLEPGSYTTTVRISGRRIGNSPQRVTVTLTVRSPGYARERVSPTERTEIVTPDSTLRLIVPQNATSDDVDIEAKKLDVDSLTAPPGDQERVILAVRLQTLAPGGETPQPTTYSPGAELRLLLPEDDAASCNAGRVRVYRVDGGEWELLNHRCDTDEEGQVWAVSTLTSFSAFVLTVDDTAYPTGSICWSVSNILSWTSSRTSGDQAAASPVLVWLEGVLRLWLSLSCR